MRCPYCNFKFGNGKSGIRTYYIDELTSSRYEDSLQNTIKLPSVFVIYVCDVCGGFLTTDVSKAYNLQNGTDDIFQVDENEKIEASAKLFNVINHLHINRDDFIEGMLKDIFG